MKVPMTFEGSERLREELNHLKSVVRPQIIQAIATAREHGDLRENAEYHAAKEQQGFAEGRVKEIENKLANAQIIDVTKIKYTGKVVFGSTVTLVEWSWSLCVISDSTSCSARQLGGFWSMTTMLSKGLCSRTESTWIAHVSCSQSASKPETRPGANQATIGPGGC
jgi:hypothetical protein